MSVDNANPAIVTMLRLAKLNEEIRRDEFGNPGDDTFIDVVRDFSHMASDNPEKLRRQPSKHAEVPETAEAALTHPGGNRSGETGWRWPSCPCGPSPRF
ncbi:hypothetical protein HPB49_026086 [Dermacentor silvarum]|nr:hypothetical protein HPB49_026086 [Dermacentor silvarum]